MTDLQIAQIAYDAIRKYQLVTGGSLLEPWNAIDINKQMQVLRDVARTRARYTETGPTPKGDATQLFLAVVGVLHNHE